MVSIKSGLYLSNIESTKVAGYPNIVKIDFKLVRASNFTLES
jgi:hypothetical protein